jgi:adenylate cyclase
MPPLATTPRTIATTATNPTAFPEAFVLEPVPFVTDRARATIGAGYVPAPDHKALALSASAIGIATAQRDEETAKSAAIAMCQRNTEALRVRSPCDVYALGNTVVFARGRLPMPPAPWVVRDPSIESPFAAADAPLVTEKSREALENSYGKMRKPKALALAPTGYYISFSSDMSSDEASRRALERCAYNAGVACMIVAVDDSFIVPLPKSKKVVGFARPGIANAVAPALREDVDRRLAGATKGWSAVAVGAGGRVGIKVGGETERAATEGAMEDCAAQDRECRVAAISPFLVERSP